MDKRNVHFCTFLFGYVKGISRRAIDKGNYFEKLKDNYEWQIIINNRPDNFIKIVKFEK